MIFCVETIYSGAPKIIVHYYCSLLTVGGSCPLNTPLKRHCYRWYSTTTDNGGGGDAYLDLIIVITGTDKTISWRIMLALHLLQATHIGHSQHYCIHVVTL